MRTSVGKRGTITLINVCKFSPLLQSPQSMNFSIYNFILLICNFARSQAPKTVCSARIQKGDGQYYKRFRLRQARASGILENKPISCDSLSIENLSGRRTAHVLESKENLVCYLTACSTLFFSRSFSYFIGSRRTNYACHYFWWQAICSTCRGSQYTES